MIVFDFVLIYALISVRLRNIISAVDIRIYAYFIKFAKHSFTNYSFYLKAEIKIKFCLSKKIISSLPLFNLNKMRFQFNNFLKYALYIYIYIYIYTHTHIWRNHLIQHFHKYLLVIITIIFVTLKYFRLLLTCLKN